MGGTVGTGSKGCTANNNVLSQEQFIEVIPTNVSYITKKREREKKVGDCV